MKVLSALLCLTLAYGASASIFKQYSHFIPGLNIKEFDYNDQQRHRDHHPGQNKHSEHHVDHQQYQSKRNHQDYTPSEQFNHQYLQQNSQSSEQQYPSQQWNQPQNLKNTQDQPQSQQYPNYQNPTRHSQYQQSSTQNSQEQDKPYNHFQQSGLSFDEQKYDHSSSESRSQESKEKKSNYNNVQPGYGDKPQWGSAQQSSAQDNDMSNNEDDVQWRNLKMTVGSNISVQEKENIEKIFRDAQSAMKHPTEEEKMKYHEALDLQPRSGDENNVIFNATQLAQKYHYPIEEHTVRTDDGHYLTMVRILPKDDPHGVQKRLAVFLMHGLFGSSDDWMLRGPQSLAYLLSDAGYDVWLGNIRGNKYSRNHVSKSPALHDFWQFSNDDIALHDLPAQIDYVLKTTSQKKLYYVGHSQGTTSFFSLTAARPEYNDKIEDMYAFSPMVYMTNVRSPMIRLMALDKESNGPFYPSNKVKRALGGTLLKNETGSERVATNINTVMSGFHAEMEDLPTYHVVMQDIPAGTSRKVVRHYSQGVASKQFQRYDYGKQLNHDIYRSEQPPKYDLQRVTAPVSLYYSEEDWLAHPHDVERLKNELPNVKEAYKVPEPHFSSMDFLYSSKAPEIVYKRVIESMKNNQ